MIAHCDAAVARGADIRRDRAVRRMVRELLSDDRHRHASAVADFLAERRRRVWRGVLNTVMERWLKASRRERERIQATLRDLGEDAHEHLAACLQHRRKHPQRARLIELLGLVSPPDEWYAFLAYGWMHDVNEDDAVRAAAAVMYERLKKR